MVYDCQVCHAVRWSVTVRCAMLFGGLWLTGVPWCLMVYDWHVCHALWWSVTDRYAVVFDGLWLTGVLCSLVVCDWQVCRDYLMGKCNRSSCRYVHSAEAQGADKKQRSSVKSDVCKDFLNGRCNRSTCRFYHPSSASESSVCLAWSSVMWSSLFGWHSVRRMTHKHVNGCRLNMVSMCKGWPATSDYPTNAMLVCVFWILSRL